MLIFTLNRLVQPSSSASPLSNPTSFSRPLAPIMSDAKFISFLEGVKKTFWHERQNLQQDEIKLQWAAKAASLTSILLDTENQTLQPKPISNQGTQMARQSTSMPWAEAPARRRGSVRTQLNLLPSPFEGADFDIGCRHFCRTRATIP